MKPTRITDLEGFLGLALPGRYEFGRCCGCLGLFVDARLPLTLTGQGLLYFCPDCQGLLVTNAVCTQTKEGSA